MFSCELCDKQYAYPHKLHHHALWLCKGRTSESCMLTSPRRSGSRNCFLLPPTPEKGEGEAELVEELKETNRNDDEEVTHRKVENEEEVFPCDACGKSFPSKNSRRKHKKKKHPQQSLVLLVILYQVWLSAFFLLKNRCYCSFSSFRTGAVPSLPELVPGVARLPLPGLALYLLPL